MRSQMLAFFVFLLAPLQHVESLLTNSRHADASSQVDTVRSLSMPSIDLDDPLASPDEEKLCSFHSGGSMWQKYATMHERVRNDLAQGKVEHGKLVIWHCFNEETCGGTGDQVKGIASALYFAMLSERTLFIQWKRNSKDMAEVFSPHSINWKVPDSVNLTCDEQGQFNVQDASGRHLITALASDSPCISMNTNWDPAAFVSSVQMGRGSKLSEPVSETYLAGCAAHFLFSFNRAYTDLAANVRLLTQGTTQVVPTRYVAIHLRFPDTVFRGGVSVHKSVVMDALHCADALGSALFKQNESWGIFFSSDSPAARQMALTSASRAMVFETDLEPLHSDLNKTVKESNAIWHSLADELMLARAKGVIQCDSRLDHCHNSGFSRVAGQLGFIPLSRVKDSVGKGACHKGRLT